MAVDWISRGQDRRRARDLDDARRLLSDDEVRFVVSGVGAFRLSVASAVMGIVGVGLVAMCGLSGSALFGLSVLAWAMVLGWSPRAVAVTDGDPVVLVRNRRTNHLTAVLSRGPLEPIGRSKVRIGSERLVFSRTEWLYLPTPPATSAS